MHGLEQEYGERIKFVRVNIHDPRSLPTEKEYGFTATPEFFLADGNHKILGHWDGEIDAAAIRMAFDAALTAAAQ